MTKVRINPGVCGLIATVTAEAQKGRTVKVTVDSGCAGIQKMMEKLGDTFDTFEVCFTGPGTNPFYKAAAECCPPHGGCPVCAGIAKCVEAEAGLALKRPVEITFIND